MAQIGIKYWKCPGMYFYIFCDIKIINDPHWSIDLHNICLDKDVWKSWYQSIAMKITDIFPYNLKPIKYWALSYDTVGKAYQTTE